MIQPTNNAIALSVAGCSTPGEDGSPGFGTCRTAVEISGAPGLIGIARADAAPSRCSHATSADDRRCESAVTSPPSGTSNAACTGWPMQSASVSA